VAPPMCHAAIVSEAELELLRRIDDVVRLGRVRRIERDRIVLDDGSVPTDEHTVHVHCAARGLTRATPRPIFEADRVTLQPVFWGFSNYQYAMLGVVEASLESDDARNRLCPAISYWDQNADYLSAYRALLIFEQARAAYPVLAAWARGTRLNPLGAIGQHRDDPKVAEAFARMKAFGAAAVGNIGKLLRAAA